MKSLKESLLILMSFMVGSHAVGSDVVEDGKKEDSKRVGQVSYTNDQEVETTCFFTLKLSIVDVKYIRRNISSRKQVLLQPGESFSFKYDFTDDIPSGWKPLGKPQGKAWCPKTS